MIFLEQKEWQPCGRLPFVRSTQGKVDYSQIKVSY
jgi:hypothetical protein